MRVTIFDYGAGNLHSLAKAFPSNVQVKLEPDIDAAIQTDVLVLPGVGAFAPAVERLGNAIDRVRESLENGLPCLGICLGMQLLFDESEEGAGRGIGFFGGRVERLPSSCVPQIGWNRVEWLGPTRSNNEVLTEAYYANSYVCSPTDPSIVRASSTHQGVRFASVVQRKNVCGVQFHPEKSSADGVRFLQSWLQGASL
jgi:imidazole glycerol-phosphate synthase subunit HisH